MSDGQLESIWSQMYYAKRALSPVRPVLKVTLFLLLHCTGVFLCIWGVPISRAMHSGFETPSGHSYAPLSRNKIEASVPFNGDLIG